MTRDYTILIIDEHKERGQQLKVILDFLGEPAVYTQCKEWQKSISNPQQLLAIIIGECSEQYGLQNLYKDIKQLGPHVPLLTIGEQKSLHRIPKALTQRIVGNLPDGYTYSQVQNYLHQCQMAQENDSAINNDGSNCPVPLFKSLVGSSDAINHTRHLITQVADTDASVLILGESGTGKEVVARNIHNQSSRSDKNFVPINCGAIPADLLESELFGHEKGAFTGAIASRKGRFELADGGTLFLDEIGDMPLQMQVKLLRVLQEKTFERVGGNKSITTDVRIIAATHRDLDKEIAEGRFREDLLYRLNVFPIELAPLRERIEDLPLLVNELVSRIENEKCATVRLLPQTIKVLSDYEWLGNVRELANLIERLAILFPNGVVDIKDLPQKFRLNVEVSDSTNQYTELDEIDVRTVNKTIKSDGIDLKEHLVKIELALIKQALEDSDWIVARAADYLHMRRTTLVEKIRKYDIARPDDDSQQITA